MSLLPLINFAGGELDPKLHDKVTLDKFRNGLATARNVVITKTGGLLSRPSTYNLKPAKNADQAIKLYCPPNTNNINDTDYVLEWGHEYVRIYSYTVLESGISQYLCPTLSLDVELSHALTEDDLDNIHFSTSGDYVYIFCSGNVTLKLLLDGASSSFVAPSSIFAIPDPLTSTTVTQSGAPSGIPVQYKATIVINGEESVATAETGSYTQATSVSQLNLVKVTWVTADIDASQINEVRIYSRPHGGGGWGLLGVTTAFFASGANTEARFADHGYTPDYNNGDQELITKYGLGGVDVEDLNAVTGIVYQGRLLIVPSTNKEAIAASRPGFPNNFYRDFPYAADSALLFKATRSGKAEILRLLDQEGLIAFTTNGVYTNSGLLSVDNLALSRRGKWVIDERLPPLVVPGGVFFVDRTNTVRQLVYNDSIAGYESVEQTIFSNHIFKNRRITSWAFQDGVTPMISVTFTDGTFAMFTYNYEHQMSAWTRGDSVYPVEQFEGSEKNDRTFSVINKDGQRYIQVTLPRKTPLEIQEINSEYSLYASSYLMDGIESYNGIMNAPLNPGSNFHISPVVAAEWDGELEIQNDDGWDFNNASVGDIIKWFNPDDMSWIEMEILSFPNSPVNDVFIVQPNEEFPSTYKDSARLYLCTGTVTGLSHLEGEEVSVVADGSVVSSPYNDEEWYTTLTVSGGSITLPDDMVAGIIHVGRPIAADIKTLPATTVEQSPTTLESMTSNKLYVRIEDTLGLYISNKFPEEADQLVDGFSVEKMETMEDALVADPENIIGNRPLQGISKRIEYTLPGSWDNQGQVAIRQVDPLHFEITSITNDLEILARSNR